MMQTFKTLKKLNANLIYYLFSLIFIFCVALLIQQTCIINITPSLPMGIYIKNHHLITRGSIVAFCLPEPYQTIGLHRGYLSKGTSCGKTAPLIKQVLAIPGDRIILTPNYIAVNQQIYSYKTKAFDSQKRPLSHYPHGVYVKTSGYLLIGNHHENSWDSRYWGPINITQIKLSLTKWSPKKLYIKNM